MGGYEARIGAVEEGYFPAVLQEKEVYDIKYVVVMVCGIYGWM